MNFRLKYPQKWEKAMKNRLLRPVRKNISLGVHSCSKYERSLTEAESFSF
jgi:hypothetical protein